MAIYGKLYKYHSLYIIAHHLDEYVKYMKELLGAKIDFYCFGSSSHDRGAMIDKTENVTLTIAPGSTLITQLANDTGTALTTLTSLLPIVALAIVGGMALFYVLNFLAGGRGGNV